MLVVLREEVKLKALKRLGAGFCLLFIGFPRLSVKLSDRSVPGTSQDAITPVAERLELFCAAPVILCLNKCNWGPPMLE